MKLCVSSYSFSRYIREKGINYLNMCDIAQEIGFEGVEFIELDAPDLGVTKDCMDTAEAIRNHCQRIGLDVVAYTVGADLLKRNIEEEKARLKQCVDVAAAMGAGLLRHDVCYGPGEGLHYHYTDAIAHMAPHIREVTEYAASKGVRTCTENHGRYFQHPLRVEALIRAVHHENYGWLGDVGNFMSVDVDIIEAVSLAAPYAFHVHFKDNILKPGIGVMPEGFRVSQGGNYLRSTIIGHGAVPVEQCLRILKNAGYNGYINVEFEGMEENLPAIKAGYRYLKNLI